MSERSERYWLERVAVNVVHVYGSETTGFGQHEVRVRHATDRREGAL